MRAEGNFAMMSLILILKSYPMRLLTKKLIIYSEQAFLEDEEGNRLQTIPTEELDR